MGDQGVEFVNQPGLSLIKIVGDADGSFSANLIDAVPSLDPGNRPIGTDSLWKR